MGRYRLPRQTLTQDQDELLSATLRAHRASRPDPLREARGRIPDMLLDLAVRPADTFRPPRTSDVDRLTLALARHVFGDYRTPAHLDAVWAGMPSATPMAAPRHGARPPGPGDRQLRLAWTYATAAGGGSVFREHLKGALSRRETHVYMTVPNLRGHSQALWYAVARSHTDDHGNALRISRSKIAHPSHDAVPAWWREVARLFARHPARDVHQIDDVVDHMVDRRNRDPAWTPAGRSLASLAEATEQWHRALARERVIGNVVWEGVPIPRFEARRRVDGSDWTFEVVQITSGRELAAEGTAQRHCVLSYKPLCAQGVRSIWSLRREGGKRLLTIELDNASGEVLQVRGLANRQPHPWEDAIVDAWMAEAGLTRRSRGWWR